MLRLLTILRVAILTLTVLIVSACGVSGGATKPIPSTATPVIGIIPATGSTPTPTSTPNATPTPIPDVRQFFDQIANAPHDTVKSSDGSAELLIPAGALPAGKQVSDISITKIDPAQLQVTVNGKMPTFAYRTEPPGLKFANPVLLRVKLDVSPHGTVPSLVKLASDQINLFSPMVASVDANQRQVTLAAELDDFPDLPDPDIDITPGSVSLELPEPMDVFVGQPFTFNTTMSLIPEAEPKEDWDIREQKWEAKSDSIDPKVVARLDTLLPKSTRSFTATPIFKCVRVDDTGINFDARVEFIEVLTVIAHGKTQTRELITSTYLSRFGTIHCKQPPSSSSSSAQSSSSSASFKRPAYAGISMLLMGPGNNVGDASLSVQGDQTQVRVSVKPTSAGPAPVLPTQIREGTCAKLGAVKYALSDINQYTSMTTLDTSLASLMTGNLVINVGKSATQPDESIYCSAIPRGVVVNLGAGRDGDASPGYAVMLAQGTKTEVDLSITTDSSANAPQPAGIYIGSCANIGAAKYPLTNLSNGRSISTLNASLDDLLKGGFAVNVTKSTTQPSIFVACGNLK